jgi:hypothetical protein
VDQDTSNACENGWSTRVAKLPVSLFPQVSRTPTVRRIIQADDVEDLLAKITSRYSLLDNYKPYLDQQWPAATPTSPG